MATSKRVKNHGIKHGYRSGLEKVTADFLEKEGIDPKLYESTKIKYTIPERSATYTPDWPLPNGVIVETKGRFLPEDRKKHLLIKEQHPDLDIRFVFSNSKAKLRKGSPTSYADWCNKNGFQYADKQIPKEWLK